LPISIPDCQVRVHLGYFLGAGRVAGERNTTDGRVAVTVDITEERLTTDGRVAGAGAVEQKSSSANGRIFDSLAHSLVSDVENKRPCAYGGVEAVVGIAEERIPANRCVRHTGRDVKKGMVPVRGVEPG
jgi:hypothetical protein